MAGASTHGVAIVGMACVFPGANDLERYWRNLAEGVDAISDAPPERLEGFYFDSASDEVDRLYCRRGGFVDGLAEFDPVRWGVVPLAVGSCEPDQLLALEVAAAALSDAGWSESELPRERTGVILGRGGYAGPVLNRLIRAVRGVPEIAASLRAIVPDVAPSRLEAIRREIRRRIDPPRADLVAGVIPNFAASRIANRLDLAGPAFTVDAACASSLVAVDHACAELANGRCDVVLAGGVHLIQDPTMWSVFAQLGALSRSEQIRPFDRRADGILAGEGVGVVVLKRLADAERDGDRVYAVIRGTGVSSDGRGAGLLSPRVEGQVLSLERAWRAAELDPTEPDAVGLLEAHGTATPAGDQAEVETLARVFGAAAPGRPRAALGSVKSMIGHAMPAAGVAGLIKAALALHHRTLPPTLHCEEPREDLDRTRFRPLAHAEPWEARATRRAAVNAFGFGGINAHVVLEEHGARRPAGPTREAVRGTGPGRRTPRAAPSRSRALLLAAENPARLLDRLDRATRDGGVEEGEGPCRLAVLDPTPERLETARAAVRRGTVFRHRAGTMWFSPGGLLGAGGRLVFLFPGVEGIAAPAVDDVARLFGRAAPPARAGSLAEAGAGIVSANRLLADVLGELGLVPDALAGHSVGEWSAMIAAGVVASETVDALLEMLTPGLFDLPDVVFLAAGCSATRAAAAAADRPTVEVALDNCPHQTVLCGPSTEIEAVADRLRAEGVLCQGLSFRSGFHSVLLRDYLGPIRTVVERTPLGRPRLPLWSATTCAPFPEEPAAIRELILEHLIRPVRFRELVERLYHTGARVFVQVGDGSLTGFVSDTLAGRPHLAFAASAPPQSGVEQLRALAAALWVEGATFDHRRLLDATDSRPVLGSRVRLRLGAPLAAVDRLPPVTGNGAVRSPDDLALADPADPVLAAFAETSRALEAMQREVVATWRARHAAAPPVSHEVRRIRHEVSLASYPELVDHSFFRLPPDWPDPADGTPCAPLAMSIALMADVAREVAPDRVVVGLERVRAYRLLSVEEPVELEIEVERQGDAAWVRLGPYAEGRVLLAADYPDAPDLGAKAPPGEASGSYRAEEMYRSRLLFHGPRYQAIGAILEVGEAGIRGVIENLPAKGALLDGGGQLLGYWIRTRNDVNRSSLPVMLDSVTFYGPEPPIGTRLTCTVRIREATRRTIRADLELSSPSGPWARILGWRNRRTENEPWMWPAMHRPEESTLAEPHPRVPGAAWLPRPILAASTRNHFAGGYLSRREREGMEGLAEVRKIDRLAGRIAAKDAVRLWLWRRDRRPIFPIEVEIDAEPGGRPRVRGRHASDLRVSIAHREGVAIAIVAEGREVGIDLERIEPRSEAFDRAAFGSAELALAPEGDRDAWRARLWAAKEALAKRRGVGLGDPRRLVVERIEGDAVWIDGCRVDTVVDGPWAIAWTQEDR